MVLFIAIYILAGKALDPILAKIHFPDRAFTWSSLLANYAFDFVFAVPTAQAADTNLSAKHGRDARAYTIQGMKEATGRSHCHRQRSRGIWVFWLLSTGY